MITRISSIVKYACQAGVDVEITDAALYDELLKVTDNQDVVQVYKNL